MPGMGPVRCGWPSERDPRQEHFVGGLLHWASDLEKRSGGSTGTALQADSTGPTSQRPEAC